MPRAVAKKSFLFTEDDVVPTEAELLAAMTKRPAPGSVPDPGPGPFFPPPGGDNIGGPREIGEGDDSDVANPEVPGSAPRHPNPKPERTPENPTPDPRRAPDDGDPTPDPDPTNPSEEEGEDEEWDEEEETPIPPEPDDPGRGTVYPAPAAVSARAERSATAAGKSRPTNVRKSVPKHPRPLPHDHPGEDRPAPPPGSGIDGELLPKHARYEGRIRVVDAFQYRGNVTQAPSFVDRNWVAFGDWDPVRQIEPGPALRVPDQTGGFVMCRPGDYVVQQEVRLTNDHPGEIRVEVWERQQFERLFLPV